MGTNQNGAPMNRRMLVCDDKGKVFVTRASTLRWRDEADRLIKRPKWWQSLPSPPSEDGRAKPMKRRPMKAVQFALGLAIVFAAPSSFAQQSQEKGARENGSRKAEAAARAQSEERFPFIGDWSGGPATCKEPFRFTPSTYIAPSGFASPYESIERSDNGFSLKFPDDYRLILTDVVPQRMTWHSPRSGDTFDLRRCPQVPAAVRPMPLRAKPIGRASASKQKKRRPLTP